MKWGDSVLPLSANGEVNVYINEHNKNSMIKTGSLNILARGLRLQPAVSAQIPALNKRYRVSDIQTNASPMLRNTPSNSRHTALVQPIPSVPPHLPAPSHNSAAPFSPSRSRALRFRPNCLPLLSTAQPAACGGGKNRPTKPRGPRPTGARPWIAAAAARWTACTPVSRAAGVRNGRELDAEGGVGMEGTDASNTNRQGENDHRYGLCHVTAHETSA